MIVMFRPKDSKARGVSIGGAYIVAVHVIDDMYRAVESHHTAKRAANAVQIMQDHDDRYGHNTTWKYFHVDEFTWENEE